MRRAALPAGLAAGCAVAWNTTNVGAIAGVTADAYGIGLTSVGLFTASLFLAHLAMQVPGGRLVDRLGAWRMCVAALAVIGAGNAAAILAPAPGLGIAARAAIGLGTGLGFVAGSAYVRRTGESAFSQGLYGGVGIAASGLALAIVPQLTPALSWRAPYASALALVGLGLLALALAPVDRAGRPPASDVRPAGVATDRGLRRFALLYSATFGVTLALSNWVVELLERHVVASSSDAGPIGGLILVFGLLTRPLGGWIHHVHPAWTRLTVGLSLVAGALGCALLALAGSVPVAVAACCLVGVGGGISFSPAFTGAALLRPDAPAAAVGFVNASAAATILICAPLLGLTFSLPGDGRLGFAAAVLLWLGAFAALPRFAPAVGDEALQDWESTRST